MRTIWWSKTVMAALFATSGMAFAGELDVRAAQQTVESQLRAFQSNDGTTAYSFAAPGIRRMFPTVDQFMGMVARGYAPIRNPKRFDMGTATEMADGRIMQNVVIVGPDGKTYEAKYVLQLQEDGTYRITAVSLRESTMVGA